MQKMVEKNPDTTTLINIKNELIEGYTYIDITNRKILNKHIKTTLFSNSETIKKICNLYIIFEGFTDLIYKWKLEDFLKQELFIGSVLGDITKMYWGVTSGSYFCQNFYKKPLKELKKTTSLPKEKWIRNLAQISKDNSFLTK